MTKTQVDTISMKFLIHSNLQHESRHPNTMKIIDPSIPKHVVLSKRNSGKQYVPNYILSPTIMIAGIMFRIHANISYQARGH